MEKLLSEVKEIEKTEYGRAAEKFGGTFASAHEGYAVLKEEYEEARDASKMFSSSFHEYWTTIKCNNRYQGKQFLYRMLELAECAAAEWLQVCAMCAKAIQSEEDSE